MFVGLYIIFNDSLEFGSLIGNMYALFCTILFSISFVLLSKYKEMDRIVLTAFSGICLSVLAFFLSEDLKIDFINNINIFIGQNAQGKTNIVEAIYYAAMGKSHRSNNDQELIKWQKNNAMIKLDFTRLEIENNLNFQFKLAQNKEGLSKYIIDTFMLRQQDFQPLIKSLDRKSVV